MILSPCFARSRWLSKQGGCALVLTCAALCLYLAPAAEAQHPLISANEPPGALGYKRRIAGGDIGDDIFQPVRIIVPSGARVGPADSPVPHPSRQVFGLNVGRPYRFVISHVPLLEDLPLYPSIELLDRTYPPPGMEIRFAIPIEFSTEDLRQAAAGNYVERVVYLENPDLALAIGTDRNSSQRLFDVDDDEDPLAVAGSLGRPVAIVRLGSKSPDSSRPDDTFLFGSPPVQYLNARSETPLPSDKATVERPRSLLGKSASPILNNSRLRRIGR